MSLHTLRRLPLLLCFWVGTSCAQTSAGVPYASLYQALEPGLKLAAFPRLAAVQRITSKNPEVAPASIQVWIDSPEGRIEVPVAADGRVSFPMRDEWRAGPTTVASNQPRGSLSVSLSFEVMPPTSLHWSWTEFAETRMQAQAALELLEGAQRQVDVAGVEFRMPSTEDTLTVESPHGEDLLTADGQHRILLRWDERMPPQQTRIRFSQVPRQAFPYLRDRH